MGWGQGLAEACSETGKSLMVARQKILSRPVLLSLCQLTRELTPTMATSTPALLATNTLYEIEQAAQVG